MTNLLWFSECNYKNKHLVGGKNASLGELVNLSQLLNFKISNGFALTTNFYKEFIKNNNIENKITNLIENLNTSNIDELENTSKQIKNIFKNTEYTDEQIKNIKNNYEKLGKLYNTDNISVAIRSSGVAEDLPNASFAGQHSTYLNISGLENILIYIKKCCASLFNSRALSYRKRYNIPTYQILMSVAIQKMVRSDIGSAGVAFSLDTETGYNKSIVINSSFGLGELVVNGGVKPDEIILDKRVLQIFNADPIIYKTIGHKNTKIICNNSGGIKEVDTTEKEKINFSLSNKESIELGKIVYLLEKEYCKLFNKNIAVDVEWALDGIDKQIYIIQTRAETIHSNNTNDELTIYNMSEKGELLLTGVSVGNKISSGKVKILSSIKEHKNFNKGDILVTAMTTPDWEPLMKISSGIITNKGGRTCHAAIVARELGINAVVGTATSTKVLKNNQEITLNCADGEIGEIYDGLLKYEKKY